MSQETKPDRELEPVVLKAGDREFTAYARVIALDSKEANDFVGRTRGLLGVLLFAEERGARPMTFAVSRLSGEAAWHVDGVTGANGFPHLSRPFGSGRRTGGHLAGITPPATPFVGILPALAGLLDREARATGLVDEIGLGIPMRLAVTR